MGQRERMKLGQLLGQAKEKKRERRRGGKGVGAGHLKREGPCCLGGKGEIEGVLPRRERRNRGREKEIFEQRKCKQKHLKN